jgi:FKBP-type peptidyl-prolyl cis-trans isomerase FklB
MKRNLIAIFFLALFAGFFVACESGDSDVQLVDKKDSVSYAIGSINGRSLLTRIQGDTSSEINNDLLIQGLIDALKGVDSLILTPEMVDSIFKDFQLEMQQKQMEQMAAQSAPVKAEGQKFLEENKKKQGVVTTASGLQYKIVKQGSGKKPTAADVVTVHYEGKLLDGTVFDSSYERKEPAQFQIQGVIPGWQEGLQLMNEGSTFELYIPSDLAYGDMGNNGIPGGATLIFKVELIKIGGK